MTISVFHRAPSSGGPVFTYRPCWWQPCVVCAVWGGVPFLDGSAIGVIPAVVVPDMDARSGVPFLELVGRNEEVRNPQGRLLPVVVVEERSRVLAGNAADTPVQLAPPTSSGFYGIFWWLRTVPLEQGCLVLPRPWLVLPLAWACRLVLLHRLLLPMGIPLFLNLHVQRSKELHLVCQEAEGFALEVSVFPHRPWRKDLFGWLWTLSR